MSSNIYKNYQVNMGIPFQVRVPMHLQTENNQVVNNTREDAEERETIVAHEKLLEKAQEDAAMIVKEAELEAIRIIKGAYSEAAEQKERIIEEAKQQGYLVGYNQAVEQYQSLVDEAQQLKEESIIKHDEAFAEIEKEVVQIILNIAKKVIGNELMLKNENILTLVRQACEKCSNRETVLIKVSMEDYDFVKENLHKITSQLSGINEIEIRKDPFLVHGDCIVETPYGSVDGGIQTKLRKIEEEFMKVINL